MISNIIPIFYYGDGPGVQTKGDFIILMVALFLTFAWSISLMVIFTEYEGFATIYDIKRFRKDRHARAIVIHSALFTLWSLCILYGLYCIYQSLPE